MSQSPHNLMDYHHFLLKIGIDWGTYPPFLDKRLKIGMVPQSATWPG